MKRVLHILRLGPLAIAVCLGILMIATVAIATQLIRSSEPVIYNVDGPSPTPVQSDAAIPSMCDDIASAVGARTGLGETLRSKGLVDRIPADAASRLGSLGTVHCFSDDLDGRLAVVLLNSQHGKAIVLTNDKSWSDGLRNYLTNEDGVSMLPSADTMDIFIGNTPAESDLTFVHVDTMLGGNES